MKIQLNEDQEIVREIKQALKDNNGYCPCVIETTEDTKCLCKDFRDNVEVGQLCHCGLFRKIQA